MKPSDSLRMLSNATASWLARNVPMDMPAYRMDGAPIRTAEDLAVAANLSITEARYRFNTHKDLYGDVASHPVNVGVGTVLERARTLARPKRTRRRKKKKNPDS